MRTKHIFLFCCIAICLSIGQLNAQNMRFNSFGRSGGGATDSLQKRDKSEDSIAIYYRLYNSLTIQNMDTAIADFYSKFILPYSNYHLGNLGNASKSYLFNPLQRGGWDAGRAAGERVRGVREWPGVQRNPGGRAARRWWETRRGRAGEPPVAVRGGAASRVGWLGGNGPPGKRNRRALRSDPARARPSRPPRRWLRVGPADPHGCRPG